MNQVVPTEQQESESFAAWLRVKGYPFTHIPNETGHTPDAKRRAIRMKRAGTSPGFPDYLVFPETRRIAIEMKRKKGGTVKPEQRKWLETLAAAGFACAITKGRDEAVEFVETVLGENNE